MARFHSHLWEDLDQTEDTKATLLLSATMLWLRSLDGDIGYENYIRLFVPFSNDLYFGKGIPWQFRDKLPLSCGRVLSVVNCTDRLAWVRNPRSELNLSHFMHVSNETKIHIEWIEWALGTAIIKLWEAGIDWIPKPKAQTIGGLEVADFSDL